jgi:tetratricopeptide (TPR) repeat protein
MDAAFFLDKAVKSLDRYHYDKALKYFRKAVEYEPENPANHCNMAGILSEMGEYAESNRVLKHVVEQIDPTMTECYFYMSNNYANMEDFEAAEDALVLYLENDIHGHYLEESEEMIELLSYELERPTKVTKIKSRQGMFEHDRARALLEEGKFTEAIRLLERLVRQHPDFLAAHNNLALAYFYVGRTKEAMNAVKRVLDAEQGNLHALCNLAVFYQHTGELEEIEKLLRVLDKLKPFHHEHAFKLATTLGVLGHHKTALHHLQRLLKSEAGQSDPCLFHYAAVASYNIGQYTDARRLWKQAEKLDPGSDVPAFYLTVLDRIQPSMPMKDMIPISYHYHLSFEEQFRHLQRARHNGSIPERVKRDPLVHAGFMWALSSNDRPTKLQAVQAFGLLGDEEIAAILRKMLLVPREDEYVKKMILFALRSAGYQGPIPAVIGGHEVMFEHAVYTPNLPVWEADWQAVMDLAMVRMSARYDMIQQYDMVTVWVEFLTRTYPTTPKITKKEGWAAALEYLTAKMHRRTASYQDTAQRYQVSIATVSKHAKQMDEVCGLGDKMQAIFANLDKKV